MMADISLPSTPAQISVVDQHWTFQTWWTSKLSQRQEDWLTALESGEWGGGLRLRVEWGHAGALEGEEGLRTELSQVAAQTEYLHSAVSGWPFQCAALREGERERERVIAATATLQTLQRNTQPSGRLILNYRLTSILLLVSSLLILTLESRHSWYSR